MVTIRRIQNQVYDKIFLVKKSKMNLFAKIVNGFQQKDLC